MLLRAGLVASLFVLALSLARPTHAQAGPPDAGVSSRRVEASAPDLPRVKTSFLLTSVLIQYPLMLGLPLALGLWLRRRLGVPLRVWGLGIASFIVSQIVHLPLNAVLGLSGREGPFTHAPLAVLSIVLGLSAGLCEELTRYAAFRLVLKQPRGWSAAMLCGAGHGGIEAIIFGLLAAYSLITMLALPALGEVARRPDVQAAAWSYVTNPWYLPIYAGLERVGAMMCHLCLSVLVMRAVTDRALLWLAAAVAVHAALDGLILPLKAAGVGPFWQEVIVLAIGGALLALALRLRSPASAASTAGG